MTKYAKCKNEQEFKMAYVKEVLQPLYRYTFCIETEETVKGFPDVMCVDSIGKAHFFEFKFTRTNKIKFQPTQPAFYKKCAGLDIWLVAYKAKTDEVVDFPVWDMSTEKGERRFYLDEKSEVLI